MKDENRNKTRSFWAENLIITENGNNRRLNFWDLPTSLYEQMRIAFPALHDPPANAALELLKYHMEPGILKSALSIGCGTAHKELKFVENGIVEHFTLVELVPELLNSAKTSFSKAGLNNNVYFIEGDYKDHLQNKTFDLVYFDNSLHHLDHIDSTIADMVGMLNPNGFFLMDDFVGPTYNQFSDEVHDYAQHVRRLLPASFFEDPEDRRILFDLPKIPVQAYLDTDPSEAIDSASILPSIAKHMPEVEIIPTGGLIYYLAAREIFDKLAQYPDRDDAIIRLLFELDRVLVKSNPELTCYALAIWQKPTDYLGPAEKSNWKNNLRWPEWHIPI
ncbi:MAG: class I SAM-dependent methyltransferase [Erythrobacter sp.]